MGGGTSSMMGTPSVSATQPAIRLLSSRRASPSLLPATVLVAASYTKGGSSPAGAANAIGFVPSRGSAPNVGSTLGGHEVMQTPIMSCSRAIMAWYEAMP